jgi:DNA-binding response OmpR family regulator
MSLAQPGWGETMRSVLVIDDELELLRQMAVALRSAGYRVDVAPDGQAGLARFLKAPTDLVVTDIVMPNREGIETILALKRASATVKVIAVTGGYRAGPDDFLNLARHVGADAGLAKPFRLRDLVALAANVLAPSAQGAAA